jgi:hypothetical protein
VERFGAGRDGMSAAGKPPSGFCSYQPVTA